MKIIHCSDLHLDSAMGSNLSPEKAKMRNAELCATFARLVRFAVREQVEAVLIAGDLFDSERVSMRTADFVIEQIRGANSVTFFYIRGNHDESRDAFGEIELPENLITFDSEWKSYRCGDAVVTAICQLRDVSMVSSGIYERYFYDEHGNFYHHILNPETGYPCDTDLLQVTIISESSAVGDALSTACFAMGMEKGIELVNSLNNVYAVFLTSDGTMHFSEGFLESIPTQTE